MNTVAISGRITADPELKQIKRGEDETISCVRVGLAVQDGKEQVDFIPISAFGKSAEFLFKYFKKGSRIEVAGELRQNRWKDNAGNARSEIYVRADRIYFGETKSRAEARSADAGSTVKKEAEYYTAPGGAVPNFEPFSGDDELPF